MSDNLARSVFPSRPEEWLLPLGAIAALEEEETVESWADSHEHATLPLTLRWDDQVIAGRYCSACSVIRTPRYAVLALAERPQQKKSWRVWEALLVPLAVSAFFLAMVMAAR